MRSHPLHVLAWGSLALVVVLIRVIPGRRPVSPWRGGVAGTRRGGLTNLDAGGYGSTSTQLLSPELGWRGTTISSLVILPPDNTLPTKPTAVLVPRSPAQRNSPTRTPVLAHTPMQVATVGGRREPGGPTSGAAWIKSALCWGVKREGVGRRKDATRPWSGTSVSGRIARRSARKPAGPAHAWGAPPGPRGADAAQAQSTARGARRGPASA